MILWAGDCFLRIMSSYPERWEDISIPNSYVLLCRTAAPGKFAVLVTLAILMSLQKGKKIMPNRAQTLKQDALQNYQFDFAVFAFRRKTPKTENVDTLQYFFNDIIHPLWKLYKIKWRIQGEVYLSLKENTSLFIYSIWSLLGTDSSLKQVLFSIDLPFLLSC